MSTNTGLAAAAKAILDAHDAPQGPSKAETIKALAALIAGAPDATPMLHPTGEQLYMMVTSRFQSGSFPWGLVSESGQSAWDAAAADLLLEPDTITAKLAGHMAAGAA